MKLKDIGEFGLIDRISKKLKTDGTVIRGIGDDAAVIRWKKNKYLLFASDMLIEDIHFKRANPPFGIGRKALAINISDIAAMGGLPRYASLSLGAPKDLDLRYIDDIYRGVKATAKTFGVNIVGGDTCLSEKIIIDIAVIGEARKDGVVLRSGARPGDVITVTGALGGSIKKKHLSFTPRIDEALFLVRHFNISSMIDISDGLSSDLNQICRHSRVGARIYESLIPLSKGGVSVKDALSDGEDFELLFTIKRRDFNNLLRRFRRRFKTPLTVIGEVRKKRYGIYIISRLGKASLLKPAGFAHF